MSETVLTIEDAARSLPDVVDHIQASGEATLLTRWGKPVARIVPVSAQGAKQADLIAFVHAWRAAHPEQDEQFAQAIEASRRAIQPPRDPWE